MYDFYFGENSHVEQNEETFLISIKRMLPKWMISIPDSEFLTLHRLIKKYCPERTVLVETISNYFKKDVNLHRSFVNSISTSEHTD